MGKQSSSKEMWRWVEWRIWRWVKWTLLALFILFVCYGIWEVYDYCVHVPKIVMKQESLWVKTGTVLTLEDLCEIKCKGAYNACISGITTNSSTATFLNKDGVDARLSYEDDDGWRHVRGKCETLYVGDEGGTIKVTIYAVGYEPVTKEAVVYVTHKD